ncbi:glycoside hydrolase family 3 [Aliifodinibius sp. S!AR15-10]|uniref:glycoside hydrolase family 3 protein n=1 Tax=Aliifodinibius sp. S!AR15-10 TaxID=2950437 RepID=UPI00285986FC|nr:glycoside hydrolase family 3 N-terminal domain-containing protein [Aliifodinibius sp. S!AR15-10]MDR8392105.1 glycoside hydrolase family 3 [Aliifodinibius sp. S!AR15-10]
MMRTLLSLVLAIVTCVSGCAQPAQEVTFEDKIGQMLMVGFRGTEVDEKSPIVADIREGNIGGVILFDYDVPTDSPLRNIQSAEQVKKLNHQLQNVSSTPLFIAVDQEGGNVARLKTKFGFPKTVTAEYLGSLNNADSTRFYARYQSELLNKLGFNLNFAPVVDLNTNPKNPIIGKLERSFSADPDVVTKHARIVVDEHLNSGIIPVLKHFPGHGSAWNDSHKGIADVTETWEPVELKPYQNLIASDSIPAVMTAHVFNAKLDSTYPATLSKPVLSGVLRDSLNFGGIIFSDDMQMNAIRSQYGLQTALKQGINAGLDVLVFANNSIFEEDIAQRAISIINRLVENGEIPKERIEESYKRIMEVKRKM